MDELLKKIAEENEVELADVEEILNSERKNVYKKKRYNRGDLKEVIGNFVDKKEGENANKKN